MKKLSLFPVFVAVIFMLSSCGIVNNVSIDKRRYNKGYHISMRDQKRADAPPVTAGSKSHTAPVVAAPSESPATQAISPEPRTAGTEEKTAAASAVTASARHKWTSAAANPAAVKVNTHKTPLESLAKKPFRRALDAPASGDVNTILLVVLAFLIPPLAIYLVEQASTRFWIALICCLVSFGGLYFTFGWLLWVVSVVLALMAVLGS